MYVHFWRLFVFLYVCMYIIYYLLVCWWKNDLKLNIKTLPHSNFFDLLLVRSLDQRQKKKKNPLNRHRTNRADVVDNLIVSIVFRGQPGKVQLANVQQVVLRRQRRHRAVGPQVEGSVGPRGVGMRRQRPDAADQRLKGARHTVFEHSQLRRRHAAVEQVGRQQRHGRRTDRSHRLDDHANSKRG